jgi:hypothetical protein
VEVFEKTIACEKVKTTYIINFLKKDTYTTLEKGKRGNTVIITTEST